MPVKKTDAGKLADFTEQAARQGVEVTAIIGSNRWVLPDRQQQAALAVAIAGERFTRIHLDIEPHTLPGYRADKTAYQEHYLKLIEAIRQRLGRHYLSVAVPVHWPAPVYRRLAQQADQIVLMAYGSGDPEILGRRLATAFSVLDPARTVIALRFDDYDQPLVLEQTIAALEKRFKVTRFALHSLKTLARLFREPPL